jgi:hypothetical protein
MKKLLLLSLILTALVGVTSAQSGSGTLADPYYGTISTDVTWDLAGFPGGIVYVGTSGTPEATYSDLTINSGGHLTISGGITVVFQMSTSDLIVTGSGILTATGTSDAHVAFTKGSSVSHWGHISFETPGTSTPITGTGSFSYCDISYGYVNGVFPNPNSAGGAIQVNAPDVTIDHCTFTGNYAIFGGAVTVNENQNTVISNCYFKSNNANECAGALLLYLSTTARVENCIFEGNACAGTTQAYYGGGAIWTRSNTSTIVNCTFVNNTSPRAGDALYSFSSSGTKIINSIFWGSSDQYGVTTPAPVIAYCAFQGTKPAIALNSIVLNSDNTAPDGPNFTATDGSDWSILFDSPCRDAGTDTYTGVTVPATDYIGNPAVETKDMGAYEVQYTPTAIRDLTVTKDVFSIYSSNNIIYIKLLSDEWDGRKGDIKIIDLKGNIISDIPDAEFHTNYLLQVPVSRAIGINIVEIKSGPLSFAGKVLIK